MNKQLATRIAKIEEKLLPDQPERRHVLIVGIDENVDEARARYCEANDIAEGANWIVVQAVDMSKHEAEGGG